MTTPAARQPYDTFRPVVGAWVARGCAVASVLVFGGIGIFGQSMLGTTAAMELVNRVSVVLLGLLIAGFLWRYAVIRAVPTQRGLKVVNLVHTHDLEWAQIVSLGFGGGTPWAMLELTDTEEVAVMAIQRADGQRGKREAGRLAALIEHHQKSITEPDR